MPEGSKELWRFHFKNASGQELETLVANRDETSADIKRTARGVRYFQRVKDKDGFVLSEQTYAEDGEMVIRGFQRRLDRTLLSEVKSDSSVGTITIFKYWWDGKSLFQKTVLESASSYSIEDYHRSGIIWVKYSGTSPSNGWTRFEEYEGGKLVRIREKNSTGPRITVFRQDGTIQYIQQFVDVDYYDSGSVYLRSVQEFATDGKTVARTITMTEAGYIYASHVEIPNTDGSVLTRDLQVDGFISHQETRKASGEVVDKLDYGAFDHLEVIDPSRLHMPDVPSPTNIYLQTENDPKARIQEP